VAERARRRRRAGAYRPATNAISSFGCTLTQPSAARLATKRICTASPLVQPTKAPSLHPSDFRLGLIGLWNYLRRIF